MIDPTKLVVIVFILGGMGILAITLSVIALVTG